MGVALIPARSEASRTFLNLRRSEIHIVGGPREIEYRMGHLLGVCLDYGTFVGDAESKQTCNPGSMLLYV